MNQRIQTTGLPNALGNASICNCSDCIIQMIREGNLTKPPQPCNKCAACHHKYYVEWRTAKSAINEMCG